MKRATKQRWPIAFDRDEMDLLLKVMALHNFDALPAEHPHCITALRAIEKLRHAQAALSEKATKPLRDLLR